MDCTLKLSHLMLHWTSFCRWHRSKSDNKMCSLILDLPESKLRLNSASKSNGSIYSHLGNYPIHLFSSEVLSCMAIETPCADRLFKNMCVSPGKKPKGR